MKKHYLLIGLFSAILTGCNLIPPNFFPSTGNTDSTKSSSQKSETFDSNPVLEEMCYTANKNEARANKLYRGKIVSARGKLSILDKYGPGSNYYGKVNITTKDFRISLSMSSKKNKNIENYDEGQIVDSGNVKVSSISIHSNGYGIGELYSKLDCYIFGE